MSEIATGCGSRILQRMYNGEGRERHGQSVANPAKTNKRGMDDMEEVLRVYGDFTYNTCPGPAFGEMDIVIMQDPLAIP
jgi:hypothetical protein